MKNLWNRFVRWLKNEEPPCEHIWRPAIAVLHNWGDERKPIRRCAICKDWEPLTEEQFFAQFGETFYAALAREKATK